MVLEAARALTAKGRSPFTPAEVIAMTREHGSTLADSTIRTHVVSYMCTGLDTAHGGKWPDLERVGRGKYQLRP